MFARFRALFLALVFLLVAFASLSPLAEAESATPISSPPEFVLQPSGGQSGPYFTLTLEAGKAKKLKVNLGNAGIALVKTRSYAADVFTLINSGFGVRADGAPATGATTWLNYPTETLELAPQKFSERAFTVTIPKGTAPGQYIAALVLQTADPIAIAGSSMLKQTIIKAVAVFITVPGPVTPKLAIGQASINAASGANVLEIGIENPGNVMLKPSGTVTVSNAAGAQITAAPIAMGSVYAGTNTTVEVAVPATVAPGTYDVAVRLSDEATGAKAETSSLSFTLAEPGANATPVPAPVTIDSVALDPSRDASNHLRFINVAVGLSNTGEPVASARLTLHVTLNGALVEDFPLNASLVVPNGAIEVQARYLPASD